MPQRILTFQGKANWSGASISHRPVSEEARQALMRLLISLRVVLAVLAAAAVELRAQSSRMAVPADSVPLSVRAAEEAGARFASLIHRVPLPPEFTDTSIHGSAERRCVRVRDETMARAGDFLIGPFTTRGYAWLFKKLWWMPASHPGELRVMAVQLDGPAVPLVFHQPGVARASPPRPDSSDAFHPSRITIREAGEWMLLATSGTSWGCIVVSID